MLHLNEKKKKKTNIIGIVTTQHNTETLNHRSTEPDSVDKPEEEKKKQKNKKQINNYKTDIENVWKIEKLNSALRFTGKRKVRMIFTNAFFPSLFVKTKQNNKLPKSNETELKFEKN